ncbi:dirigent protein 22-like [Wolffia australiana]
MAFFYRALLLFALLLGAGAANEFNVGQEKKTHLHFFFHDVISGSTPTAIRIVGAPGRVPSLSAFGDVTMTDNALTETADGASKLIGRAQGFYAAASQEEIALLMTMNLYFVDGVYNGSTLALLGRNSVLSATREMAIVGGSGYFRFARGYAIAKTYSFNTTGDAIVEYDAYVLHP